MAEFFTFAVDKRLAPFWLPFGFRPGRDGVTITDDGTFLASSGAGRLQPPRPQPLHPHRPTQLTRAGAVKPPTGAHAPDEPPNRTKRSANTPSRRS